MHTLHTLIDFKGFAVDFKGFAKASVDLFKPPLTVLIGPNGTGKTNLIEAVELLAFTASGQPLHEVTDVGRGGGLEIRGGLQSCARRPGTQFSLGFVATVDFDDIPLDVTYQLTIRTVPTPEIQAERLIIDDLLWFDAVRRDDAGLLDVEYHDFNQDGRRTTTAPASVSFLTRFDAVLAETGIEDGYLIDTFRHHLRRAYVFDPSPRLMRGYDRVGNNVLRRDGSNLSSVLYDLSIGDADQQRALRLVTDRIRQLPEEPFAEIGFETTRLNDVIFGFRATPDGPLLDARLLSDGTLRTLAVLTAMETCEPNSRLVVEEFDNGVHPSRVAMLTDALVETATRRKLNVLVTTHNPATLDTLGPDQLAGVLVCHWNKTEGVAEVTPFMDLPKVDELLERGRLGDLVTRRLVETYLTPESDAERDAKIEAWMKELP